MRELLLKIQRNLKEWHNREPESISVVCISKKEIRELNTLVTFKLLDVEDATCEKEKKDE